jgi:hypothetical protein
MTTPQGRLHNPDHPSQEVLANGAACGDVLRGLAMMWMREPDLLPHATTVHLGPVHYPLDYFDDDEDPVKTPFTEATMHYRAEDLPILAWVVAPGGGSAAVVVDLLERPQGQHLVTGHDVGVVFGSSREPDQPVSYADCKVIRGTPGEILPREIREKMGLR